jgi:hypothetical protein
LRFRAPLHTTISFMVARTDLQTGYQNSSHGVPDASMTRRQDASMTSNDNINYKLDIHEFKNQTQTKGIRQMDDYSRTVGRHYDYETTGFNPAHPIRS